jgi:hypothetical protein
MPGSQDHVRDGVEPLTRFAPNRRGRYANFALVCDASPKLTEQKTDVARPDGGRTSLNFCGVSSEDEDRKP